MSIAPFELTDAQAKEIRQALLDRQAWNIQNAPSAGNTDFKTHMHIGIEVDARPEDVHTVFSRLLNDLAFSQLRKEELETLGRLLETLGRLLDPLRVPLNMPTSASPEKVITALLQRMAELTLQKGKS